MSERIPCNVCLGRPLPNKKKCICGGIGTESAELTGIREEWATCVIKNSQLEAELAECKTQLAEFEQHEKQTHEAMESIVGNSDNFIKLTKQLKAENERLKNDKSPDSPREEE